MTQDNIGVKSGQGIGVKIKGGGQGFGGVGPRQPTRLPTPGMCFYHQQIPATFVCNKCGRSICHTCGQRYGPLVFCPQCNPMQGMPQPQYYQRPPPPQSNLAAAGGSLILVAGVLGLIMAMLMFVLTDFYWFDNDAFLIFGVFVLVSSIIAMIGGIFAIQRTNYAIAVLGGIFALFTFFFLIGSILGLIGLILVAISRHEFRN